MGIASLPSIAAILTITLVVSRSAFRAAEALAGVVVNSNLPNQDQS